MMMWEVEREMSRLMVRLLQSEFAEGVVRMGLVYVVKGVECLVGGAMMLLGWACLDAQEWDTM